VLASCLLGVLLQVPWSVPSWQMTRHEPAPAQQQVTAARLGLGLMGARNTSEQADPDRRPGMSGYLLPFEVVSVHLLVVLIGAAYLARPKKRLAAGGGSGGTT
jgi:NADH-quinone oxidoreductase subunit J